MKGMRRKSRNRRKAGDCEWKRLSGIGGDR